MPSVMELIQRLVLGQPPDWLRRYNHHQDIKPERSLPVLALKQNSTQLASIVDQEEIRQPIIGFD